MKPLVGVELKRFVKAYRRAHPATREVAALLQSVAYPANVGSIFRLAEAAAMQQLILTGITPLPTNATVAKVARFKMDRVPWRYSDDAVAAVRQIQQEGYRVLALELTEQAVPYHTYAYPQRTCLVVGHEDHGVTKATLAACDGAIFLPMYGKGLSLNVHMALSIVVYHIMHTAG